MEKIYLTGHYRDLAARHHPFYALKFGMNLQPVTVQKDEKGFFVLGDERARKLLETSEDKKKKPAEMAKAS